MAVVVIPPGGVARVGASYATYSTFGEFLDELASRLGGIEVLAPLIRPGYPEYEYHSAHTLDSRLCRVTALPAHPRGYPGSTILKNYLLQLRLFLTRARGWRRILVYTPSPTASLAALALRVTRAKPRVAVAYVWGDWEQLTRVLPQRGVVRQLLDPLQRRFVLSQETWLVKHANATLVAGRALLARYRDVGRMVIETVPMIKLDELAQIQPRTDRGDGPMLFVGRMVPGKGIETLLEALMLLRRSVPSARLRLVGGGDQSYVSSLTEVASRCGVLDAVTFVGMIPNGPLLWQQFRDAVLFVSPSFSEGFPRVLYEAMALSVPIVTTAVGGVPELMVDGVQALLVRPGDTIGLADACRRLLRDRALGERLASGGRALFESVCRQAQGLSTAERIAQLLDEGRLGSGR